MFHFLSSVYKTIVTEEEPQRILFLGIEGSGKTTLFEQCKHLLSDQRHTLPITSAAAASPSANSNHVTMPPSPTPNGTTATSPSSFFSSPSSTEAAQSPIRTKYIRTTVGLNVAKVRLFSKLRHVSPHPLPEQLTPIYCPQHQLLSAINPNIASHSSAPSSSAPPHAIDNTIVDQPMQFWDMGGKAELRELWINYLRQCDGIIFVIKAESPSAVRRSKAVLHSLLVHPALLKVPILVVGNVARGPMSFAMDPEGEGSLSGPEQQKKVVTGSQGATSNVSPLPPLSPIQSKGVFATVLVANEGPNKLHHAPPTNAASSSSPLIAVSPCSSTTPSPFAGTATAPQPAGPSAQGDATTSEQKNNVVAIVNSSHSEGVHEGGEGDSFTRPKSYSMVSVSSATTGGSGSPLGGHGSSGSLAPAGGTTESFNDMNSAMSSANRRAPVGGHQQRKDGCGDDATPSSMSTIPPPANITSPQNQCNSRTQQHAHNVPLLQAFEDTLALPLAITEAIAELEAAAYSQHSLGNSNSSPSSAAIREGSLAGILHSMRGHSTTGAGGGAMGAQASHHTSSSSISSARQASSGPSSPMPRGAAAEGNDIKEGHLASSTSMGRRKEQVLFDAATRRYKVIIADAMEGNGVVDGLCWLSSSITSVKTESEKYVALK